MKIQVKRIYEAADEQDGLRVLVGRLWPRGIKKEEACIDLWAKELAPSPALRMWFGHDPARFAEFSRRYMDELSCNPQAHEWTARNTSGVRTLTLLYAAKDPEHNHALVLRRWLTEELSAPE